MEKAEADQLARLSSLSCGVGVVFFGARRRFRGICWNHKGEDGPHSGATVLRAESGWKNKERFAEDISICLDAFLSALRRNSDAAWAIQNLDQTLLHQLFARGDIDTLLIELTTKSCFFIRS